MKSLVDVIIIIGGVAIVVSAAAMIARSRGPSVEQLRHNACDRAGGAFVKDRFGDFRCVAVIQPKELQ